MGAWGYGSFENDNALDWRHDFEAEGVGAIVLALSDVVGLPEKEAPKTAEACVAIAASEVVAAVKDGDTSKLPEPMNKALAIHRHAIDLMALLPQANGAVDRIVRRSELKELWEGPAFEKWIAEMSALQARLR
jgi:hypothetical protein